MVSPCFARRSNEGSLECAIRGMLFKRARD